MSASPLHTAPIDVCSVHASNFMGTSTRGGYNDDAAEHAFAFAKFCSRNAASSPKNAQRAEGGFRSNVATVISMRNAAEA